MPGQFMPGGMPPRLLRRKDFQINQLLRLAVIPGQLEQTCTLVQKVNAAVAHVGKHCLIA